MSDRGRPWTSGSRIGLGTVMTGNRVNLFGAPETMRQRLGLIRQTRQLDMRRKLLKARTPAEARLIGPLLRLAASRAEFGQTVQALKAAEEAVAICRRRCVGERPADFSRLASALDVQAQMLNRLSRSQAALECAIESLRIRHQQADGSPKSDLALASSYERIAEALRRKQRREPAADAASQAAHLHLKLARSDQARYGPGCVLALAKAAGAMHLAGSHEAGLRISKQAVDSGRALLRKDQGRTTLFAYTSALYIRARLLREAGDLESAWALAGPASDAARLLVIRRPRQYDAIYRGTAQLRGELAAERPAR